MAAVEQWISKDTLIWISGVGLLIGMIVIPWILVKMPSDSFSNMKRYNWLDRKPPAVRIPLRILKNVLAIGLVVLGVVMSITPGPGTFPIVLGILLADFPGKFKLQRWILCKATVMKSLNWLRRRFGRPPLQKPSAKLAA